jgi:hypothetical protein
MRTKRKQLLNILNYFRSIEKKITIDSYGFAYPIPKTKRMPKVGVLRWLLTVIIEGRYISISPRFRDRNGGK